MANVLDLDDLLGGDARTGCRLVARNCGKRSVTFVTRLAAGLVLSVRPTSTRRRVGQTISPSTWDALRVVVEGSLRLPCGLSAPLDFCGFRSHLGIL